MRSRTAITGLGLLAVLALGLCDSYSGPDLSFLIFYLAPVLWVSWMAGALPGLFISAASAVVWFLANDLAHFPWDNLAVTFWNTAGRLGMFVILSYLTARLRVAYERERALSRTDFLTQVANRRAFVELLERELARCRRYNRPLTLVYMDLDQFKQVNDKLGHEVGDRLLRSVADTLRENSRNVDVISRLGGDEFALMLPETSSDAAHRFVPRLVEQLSAVARENEWPISFSVGVVTAEGGQPDVESLLAAGDALMYSAKRDPQHRVRYQLLTQSADDALSA